MAKFDEETIDDDVQDETVDDDTQKDDAGDEVSDRLKAVEQNQALNALMADPEVQEVIKLKRAGKPVAVSEMVEGKDETVHEEDGLPGGVGRIRGFRCARWTDRERQKDAAEGGEEGLGQAGIPEQAGQARQLGDLEDRL